MLNCKIESRKYFSFLWRQKTSKIYIGIFLKQNSEPINCADLLCEFIIAVQLFTALRHHHFLFHMAFDEKI